MQQHQPQNNLTGAFDLSCEQAYGVWREQKLTNFPSSLDELLVEIDNPHSLNEDEVTAISQACARANMALYTPRKELAAELDSDSSGNKAIVLDLGHQFGLQNLDSNLYADGESISALQVSSQRRQYEYIPYSNRAISWHTDGYYNPPDRNIRAMVLHCVRPAAFGGENALLDHEIAYLLMRDENPLYIEALMQKDVMTIPANTEDGVEIRPAQTGPVFSVDVDGQLHMRYTERTRSIEWKQDGVTQEAVQFLEQLLASDSPHIFRHRMQAGQGVICNNVLHNRTAFEDGSDQAQQRLYFRARYYDRIIRQGELNALFK